MEKATLRVNGGKMDAPELSQLSSARAPLAAEIPRLLAPVRGLTPGTLSLRHVRQADSAPGEEHLTWETEAGSIVARWHPARPEAPSAARAVVWVGGASGGLDGPAQGLYPAAAARLQAQGIASLRIHYRRPNDLSACVLDTLLAVAFARQAGAQRVALVGHSFGGAVVISAGALSRDVSAVVPMSTQTYGSDLAPQLSPRPLLLIHGEQDEILPAACSEMVFTAARQPKELKLFPGARHGLDEVRDDLLGVLVDWLARHA